jgi:hypothetical protein
LKDGKVKKRRPNSSEVDAAFDRLIEAGIGEEAAVYPSGTSFVPGDAPHLAVIVSARTMGGGTVAVVHTDHVDVYLNAGPFHAESPPVTMGSYPDFTVGASSGLFVERLHPVVG